MPRDIELINLPMLPVPWETLFTKRNVTDRLLTLHFGSLIPSASSTGPYAESDIFRWAEPTSVQDAAQGVFNPKVGNVWHPAHDLRDSADGLTGRDFVRGDDPFDERDITPWLLP